MLQPKFSEANRRQYEITRMAVYVIKCGRITYDSEFSPPFGFMRHEISRKKNLCMTFKIYK